MSQAIISLTTDFGQADSYVGAMRGVMLGICPEASLADISHEIRPQAVQQAAFVLAAAAPYFPPGTVHLIVVDPGVGSERRAIAVQTEQATFVAPDNGVLDMVLATDPARLAVNLTKPAYRLPKISATFHGRDIFAPAAAHLARGVDPRQMGESLPLSSLVTLPQLKPEQQPDKTWRAQVLHVDHFGNLVTSFQLGDLPVSDAPFYIQVGEEQIIGPSRTFADVDPGGLVAYVGSSGYLEIAVRNGNAADRLSIDIGATVQLGERP